MHLVAYTAAPCLGVPDPGGRPAPSGPILKSIAATSATLAGMPSDGPFGAAGGAEVRCSGAPCRDDPCAAPAMPSVAGAAAMSAQANRANVLVLDVDIPYLAARRHRPALEGMIVISIRGTAFSDERVARRLDSAGLVDRAAHQHGGPAVPLPRHAKTRQRFR